MSKITITIDTDTSNVSVNNEGLPRVDDNTSDNIWHPAAIDALTALNDRWLDFWPDGPTSVKRQDAFKESWLKVQAALDLADCAKPSEEVLGYMVVGCFGIPTHRCSFSTREEARGTYGKANPNGYSVVRLVKEDI